MPHVQRGLFSRSADIPGPTGESGCNADLSHTAGLSWRARKSRSLRNRSKPSRTHAAELRSENRALKFGAPGEIIAPAIHSRQRSRELESALAQQFYRPGIAPHGVHKNLLPAGTKEEFIQQIARRGFILRHPGSQMVSQRTPAPKAVPRELPLASGLQYQLGMLKRDRPQQCASVSAKNLPVLIEYFFRHRTGPIRRPGAGVRCNCQRSISYSPTNPSFS